MRVIAGRFGGRRLSAPRGGRTRPTADRVREALFSVLGDLEGARVLDLFAGSGALGIEALSRGAAEATFVDTAPAALQALRDNLAALEIGERRGAPRRRPRLPAQRTNGRARIRSRIPRPSIPARGRAGRELSTGTFPRCSRQARVAVETGRRRPSALPSRCSTSAATATP